MIFVVVEIVVDVVFFGRGKVLYVEGGGDDCGGEVEGEVSEDVDCCCCVKLGMGC